MNEAARKTNNVELMKSHSGITHAIALIECTRDYALDSFTQAIYFISYEVRENLTHVCIALYLYAKCSIFNNMRAKYPHTVEFITKPWCSLVAACHAKSAF